MPLTAVLALIQAAATLLPEVATAMPAVEAIINGTGTQADIDALMAVAEKLNAQAEAAESAAGATG